MDFHSFFEQANRSEDPTQTAPTPFPYQERFATAEQLPDLLGVPTGTGKTATAILGWLWRRFEAGDAIRAETPSRLVYCLPMRVLVEQTRRETLRWLGNLALHERVDLHVLMGGEEIKDWDLYPERAAILIGTQDMLLSRVLNRGYGMSRYRWPLPFALLNNDCLWVMDEVQLMGSALATTAQLDAFRKHLWRPLKPCRSLWMSATLGTDLLKTRDREDWQVAVAPALALEDADRQDPRLSRRLTASKRIELAKDRPKPARVIEGHQEGRITLVIFNTVPVAQGFYAELRAETEKPGKKKESRPRPKLYLLHSRFRPRDRQAKMQELLEFMKRQDRETGLVSGHPGVVLVSTQVVEAGVDLSAVRLWSEVAPWASAVQRLGRLNREGAQPGAAAVFWMPKSHASENGKGAPNAGRIGPYDKKDLETARKLLQDVINRVDAGKAYRAALDETFSSNQSKAALHFDPDSVLRPDDLFELFSTEPDLAGGFTDISRFVRDQDRNVDVYVFWRGFRADEPTDEEPSPKSDELCGVPFYELRQFLGKLPTKWRKGWEWDGESEQWQERRPNDVQPGMTLMLHCSHQGGYSNELGWTGESADHPTLHGVGGEKPDGLSQEESSEADRWLSLTGHTADVATETAEILDSLGLATSAEGEGLQVAAHWHDIGKAHIRWQRAVEEFAGRVAKKAEAYLVRCGNTQIAGFVRRYVEAVTSLPVEYRPWAKFPELRKMLNGSGLTLEERREVQKALSTPFRPGLRHEAASALAAWEVQGRGDSPLTPLAVYLIASHHGKVRTVLRRGTQRGDIFGIFDGDVLGPLPGYFTESVILRTDAKLFGTPGTWDDEKGLFLGTGRSWVRMMSELLGPDGEDASGAIRASGQESFSGLGPFKLAYLEAILCAADRRASANPGEGG